MQTASPDIVQCGLQGMLEANELWRKTTKNPYALAQVGAPSCNYRSHTENSPYEYHMEKGLMLYRNL